MSTKLVLLIVSMSSTKFRTNEFVLNSVQKSSLLLSKVSILKRNHVLT